MSDITEYTCKAIPSDPHSMGSRKFEILLCKDKCSNFLKKLTLKGLTGGGGGFILTFLRFFPDNSKTDGAFRCNFGYSYTITQEV